MVKNKSDKRVERKSELRDWLAWVIHKSPPFFRDKLRHRIKVLRPSEFRYSRFCKFRRTCGFFSLLRAKIRLSYSFIPLVLSSNRPCKCTRNLPGLGVCTSNLNALAGGMRSII